jgi:LPXTG-motif cell wall-anchored protein
VLGVAAAVSIGAGPAAAADPLVVTGSAPATAHGPGSVPFTYTLQVSSGLDSVTAATVQDPVLPADAASVNFDGVPVAAAKVTASGANLTIALGALPVGTHVLSFDARVQATPSKVTSSTMGVEYRIADASPAVVSSDPVRVDINEPDISVSSEDEGATLINLVGQPAPFELEITNEGFGAPPVTMLVDLAPGWVLGKGGAEIDGSPLACTSPTASQISCPIGPVARGAFHVVGIELTAPAAAIGKESAIKFTATPDEGTDTDPTNNSLTENAFVVGPSHLSTTMKPAAPTVTVGESVTLAISIHNDGPDAAGSTTFLTLGGFDAAPEDIHFTITGFDGRGAAPLECFGDEPCTDAEWLIDNLAAGATVTAHLTVKATSAGTTPLIVESENVGDVGDCDGTIDKNGKPFCGDEFTLTAIAAPTASGQASGPQLPNTGATPWPLASLGGSMVLLGALILYLARPKRRQA